MTDASTPLPRVLLVENHPAVREGLALLLAGEGLLVYAHADTCAEAIRQAALEPPDLVLMDLSLGEDDSTRLIAHLAAKGLPVVVYSSHVGPLYVRRALEAGARAYVAKREAGHILAGVIRKVLAGWVLVSPQAAREL